MQKSVSDDVVALEMTERKNPIIISKAMTDEYVFQQIFLKTTISSLSLRILITLYISLSFEVYLIRDVSFHEKDFSNVPS